MEVKTNLQINNYVNIIVAKHMLSAWLWHDKVDCCMWALHACNVCDTRCTDI